MDKDVKGVSQNSAEGDPETAGYSAGGSKGESASVPNPFDPNAIIKVVDAEDFSDSYDTRKLINGISRHLLVIGLCMALFGGLAMMFAYKLSETYRAEAVVIFQEDTSTRTLSVSSNGGGFNLMNFTLSTALDMIKLPTNFEAVKSILGLDIPAKELEGMVDVPIPRNNSNLIRIVAKGDKPDLVLDLANTLAKVSVKASQEFNQKQLQAALDSFKTELDSVRQKLASQLRDIETFKKEHQYFEMGVDHSTLLTQLTRAKARYQDAAVIYNSSLVEYENLKREVALLPDKTPLMGEAKGSSVQLRISALESSLAEARSKYSPTNPKIVQLERELKDLTAEMQKSEAGNKPEMREILQKNPSKESLMIELLRMESKVRSAQQVKEDSEATVNQLELEMQALPAEQVAFSKLMQDRLITEDQIKFLNNAVQSVRLLISMPKGAIEVYQLADKAKPVIDPSMMGVLPIFGLFVGLGFGVFIAIFIEMRDSKFRTGKEIEMAFTSPCILVVPEIPFLNKKNCEEQTLFYIRNLVERLDVFHKERMKQTEGPSSKCMSVTLTSCYENEGKSLLAYNLARYYTRLGKSAILLEFDYRKNPFTEQDSTASAGGDSFLYGKASLKETIIKGNPDRITIPKADPNMKELVKSLKMTELLKELEALYDVIIIDAPGMVQDEYAPNLAVLADLSVFIVDSGNASKDTVKLCLKDLTQSAGKPCGIILNRVLPSYIDDERIKLESKKGFGRLLQKLIFWRSS